MREKMTKNHNGHSLEPVPCRCGECGRETEMVGGEKIYPHRKDLGHKNFYLCQCGAYVGTHPDTCEPLGSPANNITRKARSNAHAHFDALIKAVGEKTPDKGSARKRGYKWLAQQLEMEPAKCHIGMMDAKDATRVVDVCKPHMARMGVMPERR